MRGSTGTPCPATMGRGTGAGWLENVKFLFFVPEEERRGGQLEEQRQICRVSHLGAHRARQGEIAGLRTSAVTPQRVLVPAQGEG